MANDDFLTTFNFEVLLTLHGEGGLETMLRDGKAAFSEVTGLEITLEHQEIREGGYNRGVRQLIGKASHPELVFKRGMTLDVGFWRWMQTYLSGSFPVPAIDGTLHIFSPALVRDKRKAAKWTFSNGIVTKVRASELNAVSASSVPIEELHIAHEGLERELS